MSHDATAAPSWDALEAAIVEEMTTGIACLAEVARGEPIAAVVLWAAPYAGSYEVLADTVARNRAGARARNQQWASWLAARPEHEDEWKTARTTAQRTQALDHDPRHGEFAFAEEPVHAFELGFRDFVRSSRYAELDHGGEDGWLEGHVRFVLGRALLRLVRDGAFDALPRSGPLRVGYAYTDAPEAIFVALVE
jgi:hypothetical protein